MSRLFLFISLFGVLLGSALGRMSLGIWESTTTENMANYLKAIHGEKGAHLWQENGRVVVGFRYFEDRDMFGHFINLQPANVTSSFNYRQGYNASVLGGDGIIDFHFDAEAGEESGILHAKFKLRDSDKSWTKDYEFKEDGTLTVTGKIGDVTAKINFRPMLSRVAMGTWEATTEGENIDKWPEMFKGAPSPPRDERFRLSIRRKKDGYVSLTNSTVGSHEMEFKVNEAGSVSMPGGIQFEHKFDYDNALDRLSGYFKMGGEEIKTSYDFEDRGLYGDYRKGDLHIRRFYRRLIPEKFLGKYKFNGKQVNTNAFLSALHPEHSGKQMEEDKQKHLPDKFEFKSDDEKYTETTYASNGTATAFPFKLGEIGSGQLSNGVKVHYYYAFYTSAPRTTIDADFWTDEVPERHFSVMFDLESDNEMMVTYVMETVVAKRWFTRE